MKSLINIISLLIVIGCKAQDLVIPLEEQVHYDLNDIKVDYLKDTKNTLNKYIGTWVGSYGTKSYEFRIVKSIRTRSSNSMFFYKKKDVINCRYIIKDNNGTIIENTTGLLDGHKLIINGIGLQSQDNYNSYLFGYYGRDANCGQMGDIILQPIGFEYLYFTMVPAAEIALADNCSSEPESLFPIRKTIRFRRK